MAKRWIGDQKHQSQLMHVHSFKFVFPCHCSSRLDGAGLIVDTMCSNNMVPAEGVKKQTSFLSQMSLI